MSKKLILLEGIDGSGKTTYASEMIKYSSWDNTINYVYFPKQESILDTIITWFDLTFFVKKLPGITLIDRSIISTYVYHGLDKELLLNDMLRSVDPKSAKIIYFSEVYKQEPGIDYGNLKERYKEYLKVLEKDYEIIYADE
ncbi:hypothetical protein [Acidianus bottle-shaped virus 3 strain ABV3]|uniref:Thymidylate kinase n=1 Tax=Acidianus bottle-shaped virus 3 strain ABV3 TaxID=1732174 RepID=A0A0N9P740_9VIRU|nr:thymidylate kinase [Acidianus bottle-shaped virus 3 strain ABV3]ALG96840.1 hypothetical protein [Acidianus bottle-shaped virus 3 strain ABV3]